ncbi:MAG: hypothetical protein U9N49_06760 [Campylobacterota bacterium]|nr:hypothetical protein [Campylobacterota bacterium]
MAKDGKLVLFEMKFQASIKKLDELLQESNTEQIKSLLEKMEAEALNVGCETLNGFAQRFEKALQGGDSTSSFESVLEEYRKLHQRFSEGCEAVLHNQFRDDMHKKESISLLSVSHGIDKYGGDAKAYREELITFCEWFKDSFVRFEALVEGGEEITSLLEELKERANRIKAHKILHLVEHIEKVATQRGGDDIDKLFEDYKRALG